MKKTYKLLVFDQDYSDEHNVPALEVMTEKQYGKWLKVESGKLNPKYEEAKAKFDANEKIQKHFWQTLKDNGITDTTKIPWDRPDLKEMEKNYRDNYKYMSHPNKVRSFLNAFLGNNGEGFGESFSQYYLMEEFVEAGIVKVFDVSEDFAKTFKKADLAGLSLCNIFDEQSLQDYGYDDYDEEDEDE